VWGTRPREARPSCQPTPPLWGRMQNANGGEQESSPVKAQIAHFWRLKCRLGRRTTGPQPARGAPPRSFVSAVIRVPPSQSCVVHVPTSCPCFLRVRAASGACAKSRYKCVRHGSQRHTTRAAHPRSFVSAVARVPPSQSCVVHVPTSCPCFLRVRAASDACGASMTSTLS